MVSNCRVLKEIFALYFFEDSERKQHCLHKLEGCVLTPFVVLNINIIYLVVERDFLNYLNVIIFVHICIGFMKMQMAKLR